MIKWYQRINWDWVGFSTSLLCAVHCAALPFLLTLSAFGGLYFLESPIVEGSLIVLSFSIATYALLTGFVKTHKRKDAFFWALPGFLLIIAGQGIELSAWEAVLNALGGTLIAIAHWVNLRLSRPQLHRV